MNRNEATTAEHRPLRLAAAAVAALLSFGLPATAEERPSENGEISQHSLLAALQIRSEDVDLEKDLICLYNSGPAGTWTGSPFKLSVAILPPLELGFSKEDLVILHAPAELDYRIEAQDAGWLVRLEPHGGSATFEAGSKSCLEIGGLDLDDTIAIGIGKGGPLKAAAAGR